MYVRVHRKSVFVKGERKYHWFRDDGTLVGETWGAYANMFDTRQIPIIQTTENTYVKPVYGRIDSKTNKFIPLCEGPLVGRCTDKFCKGFSSTLCTKRRNEPTDGLYIFIAD